jgi:hypothetical protein
MESEPKHMMITLEPQPQFGRRFIENSDQSRICFRSVLSDLCRVWRMMETSGRRFKEAWVAKPARKLWPV